MHFWRNSESEYTKRADKESSCERGWSEAERKTKECTTLISNDAEKSSQVSEHVGIKNYVKKNFLTRYKVSADIGRKNHVKKRSRKATQSLRILAEKNTWKRSPDPSVRTKSRLEFREKRFLIGCIVSEDICLKITWKRPHRLRLWEWLPKEWVLKIWSCYNGHVNEVWRKFEQFGLAYFYNGKWGLKKITWIWTREWGLTKITWIQRIRRTRSDEVLSKFLGKKFVKLTHFRGPKSRRSFE